MSRLRKFIIWLDRLVGKSLIWIFYVASTAVGQWDKTHATSLNAPSVLVQKICQNPEIIHYESFNFNYDATGLFGVYFVMKGDDDYETTNAVFEIQRRWKHLAYGFSDDEADQAKNQLKTNLFTALENNTALANHLSAEVKNKFYFCGIVL